MKGLVTTISALAAAAAFAEGVTSANTVGYTEKTLTAGEYGLAAVQFQSTESQAADLQDLITCSVAINSYDQNDEFQNDWYQSAAQLQVRVGTGWVQYYYCGDADLAIPGEEEVWIPGWANFVGTYAQNVTLAPGTGIWMIGPSGSPATFKVFGQVVGTASANITTASGYNLVANPFPEAFDLNTDKITWGFAPVASYDQNDEFQNDWYKNAPQIQLRVGTGWVQYYYCADADLAIPGEEEVWIPGWANFVGTYAQNVTVNVGEGFWVIADGTATTVVTK